MIKRKMKCAVQSRALKWKNETGSSILFLAMGIASVTAIMLLNMQQKNWNLLDQTKREETSKSGHEENLSALCRVQKLLTLNQAGIAPVYPKPYINYGNFSSTTLSGSGGATSGTGWTLAQNDFNVQVIDSTKFNSSSLQSAMAGVAPTASQWKNIPLKFIKKITNNGPYAIQAIEVEINNDIRGQTIKNRAQLIVSPPPSPFCQLQIDPGAGLWEAPINITAVLNCKNVLLSAAIKQSSPSVMSYEDPNKIKTQFHSLIDNLTLIPAVTKSFSSIGVYSLTGTYTGIGTGTNGNASEVSATTGPAVNFTIQGPPYCWLTPPTGSVVTEPAAIPVSINCNGGPTSYAVVNGPASYNYPGTYTVTGRYKGNSQNSREKTTAAITVTILPAPEPNCYLTASPATTVTSPSTITVGMNCDRPLSFQDLNGIWGVPTAFGAVGTTTLVGRYKGANLTSTLRQTAALTIDVKSGQQPPPGTDCSNDFCNKALIAMGTAATRMYWDTCPLVAKCFHRTTLNMPCSSTSLSLSAVGYPGQSRRCYFPFMPIPTGRSDIRLKNNIRPIDGVLSKISSLRGIEFDWNEKGTVPGQHDIGVIAQEVEKIFPSLVHTDPDSGYKSVNYPALVAPLIEAVKALDAENHRFRSDNLRITKEQKDMRTAFCLRFPLEDLCK